MSECIAELHAEEKTSDVSMVSSASPRDGWRRFIMATTMSTGEDRSQDRRNAVEPLEVTEGVASRDERARLNRRAADLDRNHAAAGRLIKRQSAWLCWF